MFHYSVFKVHCAENAPSGASAKVIITPHIGNVNNYFNLFLCLFSMLFSHHNILFQITLTDHKSTEKMPEKRGIFRHFPASDILFRKSVTKRGSQNRLPTDRSLSHTPTLPPIPPTAFLRQQTNPPLEPDHTDRCSDTAENTMQYYEACRSPTVFHRFFQHKITCP